MDVGIGLVVVDREQRPRVLHAHRLQGIAGRGLHLLDGRLLAGPPAERQMDAILLAGPGPAGLVLGVEFHDAAGEIGIVLGYDVKAEADAADPCDAALGIRRLAPQLTRFGVASFAEDVTRCAGDAFAHRAAGDHRAITRAIAAFKRPVTARNSSAAGMARSVLAMRVN